MNISSDIIKLIRKYSLAECYSCGETKNFNILKLDYHLTGEIKCIPCSFEDCESCTKTFNIFDQEVILCYIDDYGIVCPLCFDSIKPCEQCSILNYLEECAICQLKCCTNCKEDDEEVCSACEYLIEDLDVIFPEVIDN